MALKKEKEALMRERNMERHTDRDAKGKEDIERILKDNVASLQNDLARQKKHLYKNTVPL